MTTSIVLTVIGEDRTGLVESISHVVAAHEGNWLESRMARLAGKFAGVLRVAVPSARADELTAALRTLESQGLTVVVEKTALDVIGKPGLEDGAAGFSTFRLELVGNDRPGIVREISGALSRRGVNVDELDTECTSAPMFGTALFRARARLRLPSGVDVEDLRSDLEQLAHDLVVDLALDPEDSG